MSHSITINASHDWPVDELTKKLNIPDLRCTDDQFPDAGPWPEGCSHWYRDGVTVRAVEIERNGSGMNVRIMAGSSPSDYKLAHYIAAHLAQMAEAHLSVEGHDTDWVDLTGFKSLFGDDWIRSHATDSLKQLLSMVLKEDSGNASLQTIDRVFSVGPRLRAELKSQPEDLARRWFEKIRRFNFAGRDAFEASILVLQLQDGREVRLASYAEDCLSLLSADAEYVNLQTPSTREREGLSLLPMDKLVELLGDRGEWLSEDLLLCPALAGDDWLALYDAASPYFQELPVSLADATESSEGVDDNDLRAVHLLSMAPAIVFLMIGGIDGNIDAKEIRAFIKELSKLGESDDLFGSAMKLAQMQVSEDGAEYLKSAFSLIANEEREPSEQMALLIVLIGKLLDENLDDAKAREAKENLHKLGMKIAKASGGFFGFGSKISKSEQAALDAIKQLFNI